MLLLPAMRATTGVLQQSEAAIAESRLLLITVPDNFALVIQFAGLHLLVDAFKKGFQNL